MSKKTLLNETTIRRFMKLASIEPLSETFVDKYNAEQEEELEEGGMGSVYARDEEEEMGGSPALEPEMEMDPEMGDEEMGDEEMGGEEFGTEGLSQAEVEEKVEQLATMFLDNVKEVFGVEGEVTTDEEEPLGGELESPAPEDDPELDEPAPEEDEFPPEELEESDPALHFENLVDNITKRVASRLLEEKTKKKTRAGRVEKLTDKIVERIFSSSNKNK
tara:strand:+ start:4427 stop:5083 length:657 start_codon:yes stop_codon:yes gene_type:complete